MKKQMKLYLSLILSVSFVLVGLLCYKNVNATDAEDNIYTYEEYNATYKETKAIPTDNEGTDTIFAGWYYDSNFATPVKETDSVESGDVYAKFVDKKVLSLGLQFDTNLLANLSVDYDGGFVRLLTAVDSLNYQKVEFDINGVPYEITTVYETVKGYVNSETSNSYTPAQTFETEDAYRFAVTTLVQVNNLAATDATDLLGGLTLTITPRWTTLDGTLVLGETKVFELNDLLYEAEINDTLTEATDGTQHVWGTVEEAVATVNDVGSIKEAIVVTVLKDASIKQLNITKSMQLVNAPGKDIIISRSTDNSVQNWINIKDTGTQLTIGSEDESGSLTVDGKVTYEPGKTNNRILVVSTGTTFLLNKNASLTNAYTTNGISGAAISNSGTATIKGTISNNYTSENGGAIYNGSTGTLTVDGTITGNEATNGGAIYNAGTLTVDGTITGNEATNGGAIYNAGTSGAFSDAGYGVTIQNGTFTDNTATNGGVIYQAGVSGAKNPLQIQNGTFENNKATNEGGVIATQYDSTSKPSGIVTIAAGTFKNNEALYGGVASVSNNGSTACLFTVTGGTFQNNTATAGGVFYADCLAGAGKITKLHINNANITGNTATMESTTSATGGGAIFSTDYSEVQLTGTAVSDNTAYGKAGCDIVYYGVDSITGRLYLNSYTSFDGIIGLGAFPETAELTLKISGTTIDPTQLVSGEKYLTTIGETNEITPVVAEYYTDKGYYYGTVNDALSGAQADSAAGTGETEAIVITVLKDAATTQLAITKNIQLENAPGKTVTLSRATTNTVQNWIDLKTADTTFTLGSDDETGALIVDGKVTAEAGRPDNRIVDVKTDATFILGRNVTLQNVVTNVNGGAVRNNGGIAYLYGNIVNCETTGRGGAVYQEAVSTSSSNNIAAKSQTTIDGGTFTNNKATHGGAIAMAPLQASSSNGLNKAPGNLTIKSGTFKNNTATYGGVASVYNNTTYKFTINSGTFQNNTATKAGGAFYVDATEGVYSSGGTGKIYKSVLAISNAIITGNKAAVESTTAVAGGGAIFMEGKVRVELTNVTMSDNTADGYAGYEIAYNGAADVIIADADGNDKTVSQDGQLYLTNCTSLNGNIIGWCGAEAEGATMEVSFFGEKPTNVSMEYGKSYTIDYSGETPTLTAQ